MDEKEPKATPQHEEGEKKETPRPPIRLELRPSQALLDALAQGWVPVLPS